VIERIIATFTEAGVADLVVVTGRDAPLLEAALGAYSVSFVHNRDYATTDMRCSAALGLAFMAPRAAHLFFTPVDAPLFTAATVRALAARLLAGPERVVVPRCNGRSGHPLALDAAAALHLAAWQGDGGLRAALAAYGEPQAALDVADPGILTDLDTPGDYEKIRGGIL
jgi:CTP:molybdopterin cytidylyltransferase MocA